jgi:hypothetical protein
MYRPQEAAFHAVAVPVPCHADPPAIRQAEPPHVQRVGARVLASNALPEGIADNVAAGVAAECLHGGNALPQHLLRHRHPGGSPDQEDFADILGLELGFLQSIFDLLGSSLHQIDNQLLKVTPLDFQMQI